MTDARWYLVSFTADGDNGQGTAYAIDRPEVRTGERGWLIAHAPVRLMLDGGTVTDYLDNNRGWSLCSRMMRDAIDSVDRDVSWIEATVLSAELSLDYFVLDCPYRPEVLSKARSIIQGDVLIKPVLDARGASGHGVFRYRNSIVSSLCFSEAVRKRVVDAGCTGVRFNPMLVAT